jgi:hypothetical protein
MESILQALLLGTCMYVCYDDTGRRGMDYHENQVFKFLPFRMAGKFCTFLLAFGAISRSYVDAKNLGSKIPFFDSFASEENFVSVKARHTFFYVSS